MMDDREHFEKYGDMRFAPVGDQGRPDARNLQSESIAMSGTDDAQQTLSVDENGAMSDYVADDAQGLTGVSNASSGRSSAIPAGAKRPDDHRKPAKRNIVVNGMDLKVDVARLQDDYELMELMADMEGSGEEENLPLVIKLVKAVLGDQYEMVKENCRSEEGYISTKKMMDVIQQVFEEVGELGE